MGKIDEQANIEKGFTTNRLAAAVFGAPSGVQIDPYEASLLLLASVSVSLSLSIFLDIISLAT